MPCLFLLLEVAGICGLCFMTPAGDTLIYASVSNLPLLLSFKPPDDYVGPTQTAQDNPPI